MRYFIDCEFDGHNGPLLSVALVCEDGESIHIEVDEVASDPWVLLNVIPLMECHNATDCTRVHPYKVGNTIRWFLADDDHPVIVADSPVDIGRFCQALSTGSDGLWASADYPRMTFEVHNVDCYPTTLADAVQHNAWWDAMALQAKLADELGFDVVKRGEQKPLPPLKAALDFDHEHRDGHLDYSERGE